MKLIGQISAFDVKNGNWTAYIERLEMYFVANELKNEVRLPTLISVMGDEAYELLSTLASPKKPASLKFEDAVELLTKHLQPKPSILSERYKFRQRRQNNGESIADYLADLKKLTRFCDFKNELESNLRDQLVCGLHSETIRQRLFAEEDISYQKAVRLATTLEAAEKDAGAVEACAVGVNNLSVFTKRCKCCGDNHSAAVCRYIEYVCDTCGNVGHLRRMCPSKETRPFSRARGHVAGTGNFENGAGTPSRSGARGRGRRGGQRRGRGAREHRARGPGDVAATAATGAGAYWVEQPPDEDAAVSSARAQTQCGSGADYEYDDEEPIFQMSLAKYKPVCINVLINNINLKMEIDTGAALSCISKNTYEQFFYDIDIKPCKLKLKFYDGSTVSPLGYIEVKVCHKDISRILDLYIINKGCTNLLGRQWLAEMRIDVPKCEVVHNNKINEKYLNKTEIVNGIISRHKPLFDGTLGRYTGGTVALSVREGAQPVFRRARPLPYALRARVDAELDAMLAAGVIEPVDRSDWATPLVIARRQDGGIRICADYKESETGLYVSLISFLGFGRNYVEQYFQKTGNGIFLHIKTDKELNLLNLPTPQAAEPEQTGDGPEKKITRLAIGVEGGFDPEAGRNKYTYTNHYSVVVLPGFHVIPWPNADLPNEVKTSVQAVIDAESPFKLAEMQALQGTWDGEQREVSVHALNLKQLDNGVKIPPSGWKCSKCELTNNLWLNLTDGSILCGRKFFDGSGGNDHAVEHFKETNYPLAVKLGTITAEGKGDVFSYPEDDMVEDPYLADHLRHFGIKVSQMQKTEKSMVELELELNQRSGEWNTLQESGSELRPLHGPSLTGINNLGNSCYINSVMQVIFRIPDFVHRFVDGAPEVFSTFPEDPVNDFNVQTCKLAVGLVSGRYSEPGADGWQRGVAPHMFRQLVGRGHPDFMTKRQQDAHEFYTHFLTLLERNSRHRPDPSASLRFIVEERVTCAASGRVRYTRRAETHAPLPVPLHAALPQEPITDPNQIVRPLIPFEACLESFMKEETIEQFYSTAVNDKVTAHKITRLATFPDYLLIQLKKFTIKEDWTPAKLDVAVDMPWEVDLSMLRGRGLQPGEVELPETASEAPPPHFDERLLSQLLDMGFPLEACKKALYYTNNGGMEAASNWLMEHMTDWDFANKFQPPSSNTGAAAAIDESSIEQIMNMGFGRPAALKALVATGGAVDRAVDWIFSHADELDSVEETPANEQPKCRDGPEKYKLVAFISHMGTSTMVGHYVCHVLHDDRWVIFNDNKVALSENPPKDLGYLYLYKRL